LPDVYVINRWVDDDGVHEVGDTITLPEMPDDPEDATVEHHKLGYLTVNGLVTTDKAEADKVKAALDEVAVTEPTAGPEKKTSTRARAAKKQP
jgi:hypothetical protein